MLAGPYAPAAGQEGSDAISRLDGAIVAWASGVSNYVAGGEVDAEFQTPLKGLGPAEGTVFDVVSLGRGGQITLTFDDPIRDGLGADFAVFENAFDDSFLELAYVEVSSNGTDFVRFQSDSLTPSSVGFGGAVDPTNLHQLAGKYRQGFGTPFDLGALAEASPQLDTTRVTHVRLIDVVGDGSSLDSDGDAIFDPFPTVGSAGFDLDGVGVLRQQESVQEVVDFEDVGGNLAAQSAFNGPDPEGSSIAGPFNDTVIVGQFQTETLSLNNALSDNGSWNQWAYSNSTNTTTPGFTNQFSAFAGSGAGGSSTFGVAFVDQSGFFDPPTITRQEDDIRRFRSLRVTNTTYAALSMRDGDPFAKKFGGAGGADPDFFRLTITGKDGPEVIGEVEFFLADYRADDHSLDYIVDEWMEVDLTPIANARSLEFSLDSSDVGTFGMNTPAYFAIDDVVLERPVLPLDVADRRVSEGDGDSATTVRVSRAGRDTSVPLQVQIEPVDPDVAGLPSSVTIAGGQRFAEFPLHVRDDEIVTADRQITVSASAPGHVDASSDVEITEDDVLTLSLSFDVAALGEGQTATGTVSRNAGDLNQGLTVALSDSPLLDLPSTVEFNPGQSLVTFDVSAVQDDVDRPDTDVTVTADAFDYVGGSAALEVIDDDLAELVVEISSDLTEDVGAPAVDLEDLGRRLPPESFYNGSDLAGQFTSRGLSFANDFNPDFGSWSGWSYSNTTDTDTPGFLNQYSAFPGAGSMSSDTYAVASAFGSGPSIARDPETTSGFRTLDLTNTTYAALSMMQGDSFAKKFGGESGDDPDFFLLTIDGLDASGQSLGTIEFYLADFRFDDNTLDYIVDQWTTVDLTPIGDAVELTFSLSSSDVGMFGMNTPAYFAADRIILESTPTTLRIERNSDVSEELAVSLTTTNASVIRVPDLVTIPPGRSSVSVAFEIIDDEYAEGIQPVQLVASAEGHVATNVPVLLRDNEVPELIITVLTSELSESGGLGRAVLHRNVADANGELQVRIDPSDQLELPAAVTFRPGKRLLEFEFSTRDNEQVDGDRSVSVVASSQGFTSDEDTVEILDDDVDPPELSLRLDRESISESDAAEVISLEDVGATLGEESFNNGSDRSGGFQSGVARLNNVYDDTFGVWGGWSISNTTDTTTPGFTNQYSAAAGSGALGSHTYAVANAFAGGEIPTLTIPEDGPGFSSLMVTNTTYASISMREGDSFAKQFGGTTGEDPDFFLLTINGIDEAGDSVGEIDFYLADFRFEDGSLDYIVDQWTPVDLTSLVGATRLQFSLTSSDVGDFGMNTPAYFAIDHVVLGAPGDSTTATVTRSDTDLSEPLLVRVDVGDRSEIQSQSTVMIPAGASESSFPIFAVDDFIADGRQDVMLTVTSDSHRSASATVQVDDDDSAKLTLRLLHDAVSERSGSSATELLIHRNGDTDQPLDVALQASAEELSVDATITIPAGQRSGSVTLGVRDNDTRDGVRQVTVQAIADGYPAEPVSLEIDDDEVSGLIVVQSGDETSADELMGRDTIDVSLSSRPQSDVVVAVRHTAAADLLADPAELRFTPQNWDTPQVVTIQGTPDLVDEPDEIFDVAFSVSPGLSDPLFEAIPSVEISATVLDHRFDRLEVGESQSSVVVRDLDTGTNVQENAAGEGIRVTTTARDEEIVIAPLSSTLGPIEVNAGAGDDLIVARTDRFESLDGGDGHDRLRIELQTPVDLADFIDSRVFNVEEFVLGGSSSAEVTIDASTIDQIAGEAGETIVRVGPEPSVSFVGELHSGLPLIQDADFFQVVPGERASDSGRVDQTLAERDPSMGRRSERTGQYGRCTERGDRIGRDRRSRAAGDRLAGPVRWLLLGRVRRRQADGHRRVAGHQSSQR